MKVSTKTKSTAGKPYTCNKCGKGIKPGQKYYQWQHRHAQPSRRHVECGYPRQSELCTGKMSGVYAAVESVEDAVAIAERPALESRTPRRRLRNWGNFELP